MQRHNAVSLPLALAVIIASAPLSADTLMKDGHAIVIGKGKTTANSISWTDCRGEKSAQYQAPPYWVDKNKNCEMNAQAFGVEQKDGKYVVADAKEFGKYFPGARKGDEVSFAPIGNGVQIALNGTVVKLVSGIAPGVSHVAPGPENVVADVSKKAIDVKGEISDDGKMFVSDKDAKSWTIVNPEAVKGHEGQHVILTSHVYPDKNEVHVLFASIASAQEATMTAKSARVEQSRSITFTVKRVEPAPNVMGDILIYAQPASGGPELNGGNTLPAGQESIDVSISIPIDVLTGKWTVVRVVFAPSSGGPRKTLNVTNLPSFEVIPHKAILPDSAVVEVK